MRSMWKGAVSFGLVMIPVKLYTATEQKDIAFRQVHREDGGRIRFKRFCTVDDQEVPYEDIAKGYELPDGDVVVLTEEDMAELPLATTKSIDVVQFCPTEQLDPILFNKSYYLEPEAVGIRAYCLLRDALEQSGRIAVAQVALRQRESSCALATACWCWRPCCGPMRSGSLPSGSWTTTSRSGRRNCAWPRP
jgi:DNA end-binding protein Ku